MENKEYARDLLEKVSGLFDSLYEFMDEEEREIINDVESELYSFFKEKNLI